jgi:hypothetical protein
MTRNVLLLGRLGVVVEDAQRQLRMPDVRLFAATGLDGVRSAFAQADIDHVIMGAGLDLEVRLEIVREVFRASDRTTVHDPVEPERDGEAQPQAAVPRRARTRR